MLISRRWVCRSKNNFKGAINMAENDINVQDITENDYPMQHAGEEIDEILERTGKIHYGTIEYNVTESSALLQLPITLNFKPKQVLATLRWEGTPNPFKTFCTSVFQYNGGCFLSVCMGINNGSTIVEVPKGVYHVDYIAIEE